MSKNTAETTQNEIKQESEFKKFFKKVGSIIGGWFKTFGAYIVSFLLLILGFFITKEVGKKIVSNDSKKKDEAKENADSITESITETIEETVEIKESVSELKQDIIGNKKESDKSVDEYFEKQKTKAEKLGFTKK